MVLITPFVEMLQESYVRSKFKLRWGKEHIVPTHCFIVSDCFLLGAYVYNICTWLNEG